MVTVYKLTDGNSQTHGGCQWGEGVTHTADGKGDLCSEHWIHAYSHPLMAVLLNPLHAGFDAETMQLWECKANVGIDDDGLKLGCTFLTMTKQISVPQVTLEQRTCFGILSVLEVYHEKSFVTWANNWLSGKDRTQATAESAAQAAWATAQAAESAAWATAQATAEAAAQAAESAAWAAEAAAEAAWAAAWAASRDRTVDLIAIAEKAIREKKGVKNEENV